MGIRTSHRPSVRFRIDFAEDLHIGPGKIALIEALDRERSLNKAAAALRLSYRRAWLLLNSLNKTFDEPVVRSARGGTKGGGSEVTDFGRLLVKRYRLLEKRISKIAGVCLKEVLPSVIQYPVPDLAPRRQRLSKPLSSGADKPDRGH